MDESDGYTRKRLTESILEQRLGNGFYNSILPQHHHNHNQQQAHTVTNQQTIRQKQQKQHLNRHDEFVNKFNSQHHHHRNNHHHQQQQLLFKKTNNSIITNNEQPPSLPLRNDASNDNYISINNNNTDMALLVDEVKKRLSLPSETSIPASFLAKHRDLLFNITNQHQPPQPLSRIIRRQSLLEIGFGQLSTYEKQHVLGCGTYSTVYKGTSRLTNKLVALKDIHLERDEGVPFTAIREVSLLKQLKHNNIITLHDIIYTKNALTLVFEFVDRDLSRYMNECDHNINQNNAKLFLYQMLRGLKFCHDRRILHRDLKPQNILISLGGELKLADFGLARAKSVPTKTFTDEVVTLWYRPPDVLLGNIEYGTGIDMWGVGCIFFEMVAGYTLFTGSNPKRQIKYIFETIGTPDEVSWPSIRYDLECCSLDTIPNYPGCDLRTLAPSLNEYGVDLLQRFLKCNPQLRISAHDAMYHPYFNSLPSEIHHLPDEKSIFSISSIRLFDEITNLGQVQNVKV